MDMSTEDLIALSMNGNAGLAPEKWKAQLAELREMIGLPVPERPAPPSKPTGAIPARLVEDRRYAEQLADLKSAHPDWHFRDGQALRWEYDDS